jgi:hypothetical protein
MQTYPGASDEAVLRLQRREPATPMREVDMEIRLSSKFRVPLVLAAVLGAIATTGVAVATEGSSRNYSPIAKPSQKPSDGFQSADGRCGSERGWCCFRNDKGTITCMCVENWNLRGFGCK